MHIYPNLWAGGLLAVHSSGRQRYYRLAGPEVAHALEALGAISTKTSPVPNHRPRANHDLYNARSCYDHLAGRIAVELARALEQSQIIRRAGESQYELGSKGHGWFTHLGIDVDQLPHSRRSLARQCIDWTERRPHLSGALGAALFSRFIALGWFARRRGSRALSILPAGARELKERFSILPAQRT